MLNYTTIDPYNASLANWKIHEFLRTHKNYTFYQCYDHFLCVFAHYFLPQNYYTCNHGSASKSTFRKSWTGEIFGRCKLVNIIFTQSYYLVGIGCVTLSVPFGISACRPVLQTLFSVGMGVISGLYALGGPFIVTFYYKAAEGTDTFSFQEGLIYSTEAN